MAAKDLHVKKWTFEKGLRAQAPEFSIAIPDGWKVFKARKRSERAFGAYPVGVTRKQLDAEGELSTDCIVYCPMPGAADAVKAAVEDRGIDEFVRAVTRVVRDGDGNPTSAANMRVEFVRGANCYVMVARVDPMAGISAMSGELGESLSSLKALLGELSGDESGDGYEVQIIPCMASSGSYVRMHFPDQSSAHADAAFGKALEMARSVELEEPPVCDVLARLDRCKAEKVGAEFFSEAVMRLGNALVESRELESGPASQRVIRGLREMLSRGELPEGGEQSHADSVMAREVVGFYSEYCERTAHYAYDLLDAYERQKALGASGEEARAMAEAIGEFMAVYEAKLDMGDRGLQAKVDALGNVGRPGCYEDLRNRIEKELPGYKAKHDAEVAADQGGSEGASEGEGEPAGDAPAADGSPADAAPVPDVPYAEWWDPFPSDREPYYGGYNNKMDHAAACWLLYSDHLFFADGEITWDGRRHAIAGMQLNGALAHEVPVFAERADNYAPAFADLMMEVEKDEGLVVPRSMVHPVTRRALPEGDLTGIALMNLQACAKALMVTQQGPHAYAVMADPRVSAGVPDFLNLVGRLIWDLRAYNGVEEPFSVAIMGARNFDADQFFGDDGFLSKPVAGASTETAATFEAKPEVTLPSKGKGKGAKAKAARSSKATASEAGAQAKANASASTKAASGKETGAAKAKTDGKPKKGAPSKAKVAYSKAKAEAKTKPAAKATSNPNMAKKEPLFVATMPQDELRKAAKKRYDELRFQAPPCQYPLLQKMLTTPINKELNEFYLDRTTAAKLGKTRRRIVLRIKSVRRKRVEARVSKYGGDSPGNMEPFVRDGNECSDAFDACLMAYMDIIDRQIYLGVDKEELQKMVAVAVRFTDNIGDTFVVNQCGRETEVDTELPQNFDMHLARLVRLESLVDDLAATEQVAARERTNLEIEEITKQRRRVYFMQTARREDKDRGSRYEECLDQLRWCSSSCDYRKLAIAFSELGSYKDAPARLAYCKSSAEKLQREEAEDAVLAAERRMTYAHKRLVRCRQEKEAIAELRKQKASLEREISNMSIFSFGKRSAAKSEIRELDVRLLRMEQEAQSTESAESAYKDAQEARRRAVEELEELKKRK